MYTVRALKTERVTNIPAGYNRQVTASVVSDARKFDRDLSQLIRADLHLARRINGF